MQLVVVPSQKVVCRKGVPELGIIRIVICVTRIQGIHEIKRGNGSVTVRGIELPALEVEVGILLAGAHVVSHGGLACSGDEIAVLVLEGADPAALIKIVVRSVEWRDKGNGVSLFKCKRSAVAIESPIDILMLSVIIGVRIIVNIGLIIVLHDIALILSVGICICFSAEEKVSGRFICCAGKRAVSVNRGLRGAVDNRIVRRRIVDCAVVGAVIPEELDIGLLRSVVSAVIAENADEAGISLCALSGKLRLYSDNPILLTAYDIDADLRLMRRSRKRDERVLVDIITGGIQGQTDIVLGYAIINEVCGNKIPVIVNPDLLADIQRRLGFSAVNKNSRSVGENLAVFRRGINAVEPGIVCACAFTGFRCNSCAVYGIARLIRLACVGVDSFVRIVRVDIDDLAGIRIPQNSFDHKS